MLAEEGLALQRQAATLDKALLVDVIIIRRLEEQILRAKS
jgi:hypothetical protein